MPHLKDGWIGVDLDGTLAQYDHSRGLEHIGEPVMPMLERIARWRKEGIEVKIFTARAASPEAIPFIQDWLIRNGLGALEITNCKDMHMICLWDDRVVPVGKNTGQPLVIPATLKDVPF